MRIFLNGRDFLKQKNKNNKMQVFKGTLNKIEVVALKELKIPYEEFIR